MVMAFGLYTVISTENIVIPCVSHWRLCWIGVIVTWISLIGYVIRYTQSIYLLIALQFIRNMCVVYFPRLPIIGLYALMFVTVWKNLIKVCIPSPPAPLSVLLGNHFMPTYHWLVSIGGDINMLQVFLISPSGFT